MRHYMVCSFIADSTGISTRWYELLPLPCSREVALKLERQLNNHNEHFGNKLETFYLVAAGE